ncbi:hypothetical protein DFQ26_007566 [Actinomortierella ambigua]|nr:hypothetical protein DFQ26_007566 [Actinomortierella ambigua]
MRLFRNAAIAMTVLALSINILAEAAPKHSKHHHKTKPRQSPSSKRTRTHKHVSPPAKPTDSIPAPDIALKLVANNTGLDTSIPQSPEGIQVMLASSFGGCPPPLISNTHNIVSKACSGLCCLPCPATSTFYEPGIMDQLNDAVSIVRAISCVATLFLGVSYLVLPNRKQDSHLVLLFMFFTNAVWQGLGTIWLAKKREHTCHSDVEESTLANNTLCGAQAILLVYLTGVLFCQAITLMANMFALIVYRSTRLQTHLLKLILLSFVLPVTLIIYPWVKQSFGYVGYGSVCFMTSDLADAHFFYPIMSLMSAGVMLHLATVGHVVKMYIQRDQDWSNAINTGSAFSLSVLSKRQQSVHTAREISHLLQQQWRPAAFVLCQLVIFLVYFGFYFFETKKFEHIQSTLPWFQEWAACLSQQAVAQITSLISSSASPVTVSSVVAPSYVQLLGQNAQSQCKALSAPHVPAFHKLVLSEIGPPAFGIIVFFIFASKRDLWQDWKKLIAQKVFRRPTDVDLQTFKIIEKSGGGGGGFRSGSSAAGRYGSDEKSGFGLDKSSASVLSIPPPVYEAIARPGAAHARQGVKRFESPDAKTTLAGTAAPAYDDGFIPYVAPLGSNSEEEKKKGDVKRSLSIQQRLLARSRSYAQEGGLSISGSPRRSNTAFGLFTRGRGEDAPSSLTSSPEKKAADKPTVAATVATTAGAPPPLYSSLSSIPETPRLYPNRSFSTRSSRLSRSSTMTASTTSSSSSSPYTVVGLDHSESAEVQRATRHQVISASEHWPSRASGPVSSVVVSTTPLARPARQHAVGGNGGDINVRRTASTSSRASRRQSARRAALLEGDEHGCATLVLGEDDDSVTHFLVRLDSLSSSNSGGSSNSVARTNTASPRASTQTPPPHLPPRSQRRPTSGGSSRTSA